MGADIHWIFERQHKDGAWHEVYSKSMSYEWDILFGNPADAQDYSKRFSRPESDIGRRNYALFGALSGVRCEPMDIGLVMIEGLPNDISAGAQAEVECYGVYGHSHGYLTLGALRAFVRANLVPEGAWDGYGGKPSQAELEGFCLAQVHEWLDKIDAFIEASPEKMARIVVGDPYDREKNVAYLQMKTMSAHKRMEMSRVAEGLLPLGDDTVRILVYYDN